MSRTIISTPRLSLLSYPGSFRHTTATTIVPPRSKDVLNGPRIISRNFQSSSCKHKEEHDSFRSRARKAIKNTKIQWYPIPVGVGIGFLGFWQLYRLQREKSFDESTSDRYDSSRGSDGESGRPKKRPRIRPSGPWQIQVMSTLPLKALSRLWGRFNELDIPYYLRVPGFRLYSWIFGVNLSEMSDPNLHNYRNLAAFFYRTLKPGIRPLDPNPNALLSPADGRVLQFGTIEHGEVEQVKGMTYRLDALLGGENPSSRRSSFDNAGSELQQIQSSAMEGDAEIIKADEEFARVNGISYTLPNLFSGGRGGPVKVVEQADAATTPKPSSEAEVRADLALGPSAVPWYYPAAAKETALYYIVIYLAPGDYHRFHSPASWVVETRRHFAGELYSVSPYLQRTLPGLFTLNERVVLLGRWRWGFFSYTPVGATNVGSIKVNFDKELRTNSLTTDTAADRAAEEAAKTGEPYSGYAEATYEAASPLLKGHALKRGEEMGGFQLGSSIVLVFEAPKGQRKSLDEGWAEGSRKGGWQWLVEKGQKVKVGEAVGAVQQE